MMGFALAGIGIIITLVFAIPRSKKWILNKLPFLGQNKEDVVRKEEYSQQIISGVKNIIQTKNIYEINAPIFITAATSTFEDREIKHKLEETQNKYLDELYENGKILIDTWENEKGLEKCEEYFKQGYASKHSKYASVLNNKGVALNRLGEPDAAIRCFRKSIEVNPKHDMAIANLAVLLYEEKGELDEPWKLISRAQEISPENPNICTAFALLSDGIKSDLGTAMTYLKKAIKIDSELWPAYGALALLQGKIGEFKKARENIRIAIENGEIKERGEYKAILATNCLKEFVAQFSPDRKLKGPREDIFFFSSEQLQNAKNKTLLDECIKEYNEADKLGVRDKKALKCNLASAYALKGKGKIAKDILRPILLQDKKNILANLIMGQVSSFCEDWEGVIKYYKIVEEKMPNNSNIKNNISAAYLKLSNIQKSLIYIKKAIELQPEDPPLWANRGAIYYKNEQFNLSAENFQKAYDLGLRTKDLLVSLANSYFECKMFGTASTYFKEYLDAAKEEEIPNFVLGRCGNCFSMMKRYPEAIKLYKKILEKDPDDIITTTSLMISYFYDGNKSEATNCANKILGSSTSTNRQRKIAQDILEKSRIIIKPKKFLFRPF